MKKILLLSLVYLSVSRADAQLPVSTAPQKRKVILEEYTGVNCGYCPDGHKIADELAKGNPDNVFVVNVHAGIFAKPLNGEPDFTTPFGDALVDQAGVVGFPAGTVNRHVFPGMSQDKGTGMNRGSWGKAVSQVLSEQSYVNVALQGNIDPASRMLTVDVEAYYTGNSPKSTNYLHVYLLQDSIIGDQSGKDFYPEMIVGSEYQHNKALRHVLSGQWGDQISTTTQGYKFSKKYSYQVPAQLPATVSGGKKTDLLLKKLKIIAFVTETRQEIVTGNSGPLKIGTPTGRNEVPMTGELSVFPNPSDGISTIAIALEKEEKVTIKVYNTMGVEVHAYQTGLSPAAGTHYLKLDGSHLPSGLYVVKAFAGMKQQTAKLMINR